jgi:hypothetical protein
MQIATTPWVDVASPVADFAICNLQFAVCISIGMVTAPDYAR